MYYRRWPVCCLSEQNRQVSETIIKVEKTSWSLIEVIQDIINLTANNCWFRQTMTQKRDLEFELTQFTPQIDPFVELATHNVPLSRHKIKVTIKTQYTAAWTIRSVPQLFYEEISRHAQTHTSIACCWSKQFLNRLIYFTCHHFNTLQVTKAKLKVKKTGCHGKGFE